MKTFYKKISLKKAFTYFSLILISGVIFSSCSKANEESGVINRAKIQVVQASPTAGSLDFYLDNTKQNTNPLTYFTNTGYFEVASGNDLSVNYRLPGTVTTVASQILNLRNRVSYTLYLTGLSTSSNYSGLRTISSADTTAVPASGKAKIRLVNGIADGADVDFYIGNDRLAANLKNAAVGSFAEINAAKQTFNIRNVNGTTAISSVEITPESGKVYTILARGLSSQPTGATGLTLTVINNN